MEVKYQDLIITFKRCVVSGIFQEVKETYLIWDIYFLQKGNKDSFHLA